MTPAWSRLCPVDPEPLADWLAAGGQDWPTPVRPAKPARLLALPDELVAPLVASILSCWDFPVLARDVVLSRTLPGHSHPLHTDLHTSAWLTRVHVPLLTSEGAWFLFEEDWQRFHLPAGYAYTFDTLRRHAFGNDGATERVHLLMDVHRRD